MNLLVKIVNILQDSLSEKRKQTQILSDIRCILTDSNDLLVDILDVLEPQPVAKLLFFVEGKEVTQVTIKDNQKFTASIAPVDAKGNPATDAGPFTWSGDATLITVTPAADGLSADVAAVGPLGSTQLSVTDGTLTGTLQIDIVGGAVTALNINTTAAVDQ